MSENPSDKRDFFAEAVKILKGESMMLVQFEHLEAMARKAYFPNTLTPEYWGLTQCDGEECHHGIHSCRGLVGGLCLTCRSMESINKSVESDRAMSTGEREGGDDESS